MADAATEPEHLTIIKDAARALGIAIPDGADALDTLKALQESERLRVLTAAFGSDGPSGITTAGIVEVLHGVKGRIDLQTTDFWGLAELRTASLWNKWVQGGTGSNAEVIGARVTERAREALEARGALDGAAEKQLAILERPENEAALGRILLDLGTSRGLDTALEKIDTIALTQKRLAAASENMANNPNADNPAVQEAIEGIATRQAAVDVLKMNQGEELPADSPVIPALGLLNAMPEDERTAALAELPEEAQKLVEQAQVAAPSEAVAQATETITAEAIKAQVGAKLSAASAMFTKLFGQSVGDKVAVELQNGLDKNDPATIAAIGEMTALLKQLSADPADPSKGFWANNPNSDFRESDGTINGAIRPEDIDPTVESILYYNADLLAQMGVSEGQLRDFLTLSAQAQAIQGTELGRAFGAAANKARSSKEELNYLQRNFLVAQLRQGPEAIAETFGYSESFNAIKEFVQGISPELWDIVSAFFERASKIVAKNMETDPNDGRAHNPALEGI